MRGPPPDNAAIAGRLDAFASLLELAGAGPYTARAFRRAADLIRTTPAPVAELVRAGRVRELRGIGPGIERRLRELVETGEIAELRELEREVSPELAGVGRFLGVSVRRMLEIGRVLGVRTLPELREAAQAGRLREVPGIGPETERKLRAALARDARTRSVPRPLLLNRSRPLVESIAEALGGVATGDPRRWVDASARLAVVCSSARPAAVLDRFEALPQIVAVVERDRRRALGVTVEGVPVELVVAEPGRFGTELVRATGSPEWVEGLEPLPDAADEDGVFRALGMPEVPPELREAGFRGEPPRRAARLTGGADPARADGARLALRQLPEPPDGAADQPPAAERRRSRSRVCTPGRDRARGGGERATQPARPAGRARAARAGGGSAGRGEYGRPLGARPREHGSRRRDRPARGRPARGDRQHASPGRGARAPLRDPWLKAQPSSSPLQIVTAKSSRVCDANVPNLCLLLDAGGAG